MSKSARRQHLQWTDNDSESMPVSTGIMHERVVVSKAGGDTHKLAFNDREQCPSSGKNRKSNRSKEKSEKTPDVSHSGKQMKRSRSLSKEDLTEAKRKKTSKKTKRVKNKLTTKNNETAKTKSNKAANEKKEFRTCWLPECKGQSKKDERRHISETHLPRQFRIASWLFASIHDARMAGMRWLSDRMIKTTDLNSLLGWMQKTLKKTPCYRKRVNQEMSKTEMKQLADLCQQEGWSVPKAGFKLYPPNSPAVLFNWRMISIMLQYLAPDDRKAFYELDKLIINKPAKEDGPAKNSDNSKIERPSKKVAKKKKNREICLICMKECRNLDKHSQMVHLPVLFRTHTFRLASQHNARMAGMQWLSDRLVKTADFNILLGWMQEKVVEMPDDRFVTDGKDKMSLKDKKRLGVLCKRQGWSIPSTGFKLYPPNCEAVLFNWRMIVTMLEFLTPDDRKTFYELDKHVIEGQKVDENDKRDSDEGEVDANDKCDSDEGEDDSDCYVCEGEDEDDYEVIDLDEEDDEDEDCSDSEESVQNVARTMIVSEQDASLMTQSIEPSVIEHKKDDEDRDHTDSKESPQNVVGMTMPEQDEFIVTQGIESNIEHKEDENGGHTDSKDSLQNVMARMTRPEQDESIVTQGIESNIEHKEDENGGHTDSKDSLQNVMARMTRPEQDESIVTQGIESNIEHNENGGHTDSKENVMERMTRPEQDESSNMINHQAVKVENVQVQPSLNPSESVSDEVENIRVQPFLSQITKPTETVNNSSDNKATVLGAIDSLFHLDLCKDSIATLNASSTIDDLIAADVGVRPGVCVRVCGGVNAFCNPATYPQNLPSHPVGFKSAIGIHPKTVEELDEQAFRHFRVLSADIGCAAVGPVGLDHTVPPSKWARQEEVLEQVLQWCFPARPVVFHIWDGVDPHSGALYTQLLRIVKANMSPKQAVLLHCFTGSLDQVIEWCQCFPNCYFGFTSMVDDFDPCQKQALESVPENRLLIETHSPAVHSRRTGFRNTPAFIGDVAAIVAKARGQTTEAVLASCNKNARALYRL